MTGLHGGERTSTIYLAVLTKYRSVTDRQTDRRGNGIAITRIARVAFMNDTRDQNQMPETIRRVKIQRNTFSVRDLTKSIRTVSLWRRGCVWQVAVDDVSLAVRRQFADVPLSDVELRDLVADTDRHYVYAVTPRRVSLSALCSPRTRAAPRQC